MTDVLPTRPSLAGVEVHLVPDELSVLLMPTPNPARSLWHRVTPHPSALVSVWSREERLRTIRLTVRSSAPGWNATWVRWSFAARVTPEIQGGDAFAAQDRLADDASSLTLLLLPGEQRSAGLEMTPALDGRTAPGDYPFEVVVAEPEGGLIGISVGLLRLRHPSSGLLQYLPALYDVPTESSGAPWQMYEDPPFFPRFLRGFEDAGAPIGRLLGRMEEHFDARAAPADFLPWLATWVSLALDDNWPELKRRRLIREAVELYRWRGTRRGLSRYLEIYTGVVPQIDDQPFNGLQLGSAALLGENTLLGGVPAHTFVVTLAVPDPNAINAQTIRDIIESEKPAHAAYDLNIVHRGA